ncbi:programmed cell death protein 6 [Russula dissimulans]|nr:programmed cell death protein 6 [Russula dissimulans]
MNLFDLKRTGGLNFNEFSGLWRYIEDWQAVFRYFDQDCSGTIDSSELQRALIQFNMKLSDDLLSLVVAKFASAPSGSQMGKQTITFDRFMRACVFVKQFTEMFSELDTDKDGYVRLNYEQVLRFFLSLP